VRNATPTASIKKEFAAVQTSNLTAKPARSAKKTANPGGLGDAVKKEKPSKQIQIEQADLFGRQIDSMPGIRRPVLILRG
jgi:hypothetical protein